MMLLHIYQMFSSLQGHLYFLEHFFSMFMVNFFFNHPISGWKPGPEWISRVLQPIQQIQLSLRYN